MTLVAIVFSIICAFFCTTTMMLFRALKTSNEQNNKYKEIVEKYKEIVDGIEVLYAAFDELTKQRDSYKADYFRLVISCGLMSKAAIDECNRSMTEWQIKSIFERRKR